MVGNINTNFNQFNYAATSRVATSPIRNNAIACDESIKPTPDFNISPTFGNNSNNNVTPVRTKLSGRDEINKYTYLLSKIDKADRKRLEKMLNSGILLNSNSNDKSTVLDNLYLIATKKRANGLEKENILKWTIKTLNDPFIITQNFGDIPRDYKPIARELFDYGQAVPNDRNERPEDINVKYSSTCVAASLEFKLAKQMPAEFARYVQCLSSPEMAVTKNLNLHNLADHVMDRIELLNMFETQVNQMDFNNANITFSPDKNAILRAIIQTKHHDNGERSPIDVLLQSTFMNLGSQKTYNSLTDKRGGDFNQEDTGLNEFEKTYDESIIFGENIISVVYQDTEADKNGNGIKLAGYRTDFGTVKKQLITALDRGECVIVGCTRVNKNDYIEGGHEITIVGYKTDPTGKVYFICNDTDDNISVPIMRREDELIPAIHHAALPKDIAEADYEVVPSGDETIKKFQERQKRA